MKLRVHWSERGKPWCHRTQDYSVRALPPNTTTYPEDVTCQRCQTAPEVKRVPRKVKR